MSNAYNQRFLRMRGRHKLEGQGFPMCALPSLPSLERSRETRKMAPQLTSPMLWALISFFGHGLLPHCLGRGFSEGCLEASASAR